MWVDVKIGRDKKKERKENKQQQQQQQQCIDMTNDDAYPAQQKYTLEPLSVENCMKIFENFKINQTIGCKIQIQHFI